MTTTSVSKICSVEGCESKHWCKGFCVIHYSRWKRFGTTDRTTNINLGIGDTEEERFWSRVDKTPGQGPQGECWTWQASRLKGYGSVYVGGKHHKSHRAAWFYTYKQWPTLWLLHSCDNPPCVNPAHLREGTNVENIRDSMERGRRSVMKGEGKPNAKLTESAVREIRQRFATRTVAILDLAAEYGVSGGTISSAVYGKTWRHVT